LCASTGWHVPAGGAKPFFSGIALGRYRAVLRSSGLPDCGSSVPRLGPPATGKKGHAMTFPDRRRFLATTANGIGLLALASQLRSEGLLAAESSVNSAANPLALRPGHFPGKAKACICIYLEGAPSQLDLFDPKPKLNDLDGQKLPESMTKNVR